jgi:hypothetical protein
VQRVAALALTVVLGAGPDAGTQGRPSAEAEIEAVLAATVPKAPPAEVLVTLEGPDASVYRLEEATVHLDGVPLAISSLSPSGPQPPGTRVSDGDHVVSAKLVFQGKPTGVYPWQTGPRWVLPTRVPLQASHGLRLNVRLVVETNAQAPLGLRLTLQPEVEPQMLMAVDDTPLPPPPRPQLPPPAAEVPVATSSAPPVPEASTPPVAAKKKPKKKAASATKASGTVPASAAVVTKSAASVPPPETLEEATARLRSALAAPADAGKAPRDVPQ